MTAVLTLALGIGATIAIFSAVYAVFEPMPYPKPEQLVMVWSKVQGDRTSVRELWSTGPGALAGVGIYGVMAFGDAQRTQEFGVRMALGAQRSQVVRLVMREGTIVSIIGACDAFNVIRSRCDR